MRMKSFPVPLTTRETQSLQAQRITRAEYGRINMLSSKLLPREERFDKCIS
jgi:hypothetical protein